MMKPRKNKKGAGRPKGSLNRGRREFVELVEKIGNPEELISAMKALTLGVKCARYDNEGDCVVYDRPPDYHAIAYLLDQAYGKARQSIDVEANIRTIEDDLENLPD